MTSSGVVDEGREGRRQRRRAEAAERLEELGTGPAGVEGAADGVRREADREGAAAGLDDARALEDGRELG